MKKHFLRLMEFTKRARPKLIILDSKKDLEQTKFITQAYDIALNIFS